MSVSYAVATVAVTVWNAIISIYSADQTERIARNTDSWCTFAVNGVTEQENTRLTTMPKQCDICENTGSVKPRKA